MGAGDKFGLFGYTDDTGRQWTVRLSAGIAAITAFPAWSGDLIPWPYKEKRLRHVTGVDATTGKGAELPCSTIAEANQILSAGTWTDPGTGNVINTRGYRGEHRDARNT